ncbi:hypothetical protein MTR_3g062180 [Medicago truncatula]|uniref:Disease resistance protein At4g27190-like leucine-rich repeats domain-containing protein n=1 Tax=Medicago truncatula TaxID=3880 RepID=G7J2A9_MEDTR|nr:hypothetical protein MTR_3g062180 [Medicago truncatula]
MACLSLEKLTLLFSFHIHLLQELSGIVDHFLALKRLVVKNNSKVICLNELNEHQMNLALKVIDLDVLPMMTCLFVGPNSSFSLQNLTELQIKQCEKLKIVFSTSIIRYLPQLLTLRIEECNELKHIFEDDLENTAKTCFPKLNTIFVVKCNKLKYVFPISIFRELPHLVALVIREADELEEIFVSESDDHKVEIPNLKLVVFENLPSLSHDQGIQFQAVKHRFILNCQKLSLTSASTLDFEYDISDLFIGKFGYAYGYGWELVQYWRILYRQLKWKHRSPDPQIHELLMKQLHQFGEIDTAVKPSQVSEISVQEGTTTSNAKRRTTSLQEYGDGEMAISFPPISITRPLTTQEVHVNNLQETSNTIDDAVIKVTSIVEEQFSKDVEFRVPESKLSPIIPSPQAFQSPPMLSGGDPSQIDEELVSSSSETNDKVSRNDDAFKKVCSNIEEQFPKVDDIIVFKSKPSPSITTSVASQFPPVPSKGVPSQKVEDFSSSLLVKRELEQLLSKKHLDYENVSLLTDFFVKHPSVRLKDTSLSNRYKGYAYNCLAELLKFLQTHSVLDVLGSSHSEFVELLQDVRKFGFDKEWLDDIEKRVLLPGLQVSQDALQKLLDSKHILTQHVEDLKHQLCHDPKIHICDRRTN